MSFKNTTPEGTVLMLGIRFENQTTDKVWTYAALKAGGLWYVTGTGPTAASWTAVERWLERDGRQLLWIDVLTDRTRVWTRETDGPAVGWNDLTDGGRRNALEEVRRFGN